MRLDVAICTDRTDAPLEEVVAAVAAQGAAPLLVVAGQDAPAVEALAARLGPDGVRVVSEPDSGLAQARNRALAACSGDVLCLLEDDAVPRPGWLATLRAVWAGAPPGLGAVGGPVETFVVDPPDWLAGDALAALGSVDHGAPERDLDPVADTLMGANLSVRVAAAAGAGGFFPARGHRDARDWFSDEHQLQRELAALGWRVRWTPRAGVTRRVDGRAVTPAAVLSRRLRYGARLGAASDARRPLDAARHALGSAAGMPLALAAGRRAAALSRAARAVENAGVLFGAPLARRDFAPTGPTPFRPSLRSPADRWRPARREGALVLLYHRVDDAPSDPLGLTVAPARFAEQLAVIARRPVVDLGELAGGVPPAGAVALTFDDGYADSLLHAAPALERAGLPATVFVATGHVATGAPFFWDELDRLVAGEGDRPAELRLELGGQARAWRTVGRAARELARRHLHEWLQPRDRDEIAAALASLRAWAGSAAAPPRHRPLTLDELRALAARPGIAIGAHTRDHVSLAARTPRRRAEEIAGSRDDLRRWLGAAPAGFSYPFGVPGIDLDATTQAEVAAAGFDHAVVNAPGLAGPRADRLAIPRVVVPDLGGEAFRAWLEGALRTGDPSGGRRAA